MKGSRAKKAAEAAAAGGELSPSPPSEPRTGPARPGPVPGSSNYVQIPEEVFNKICGNLRTNSLVGAAAADALMEAAGLAPPTPQGKAASKLRTDVASSRDDDDAPAKPKKKIGGFADQVDEIPEMEEASPDQAEEDEPAKEEEKEPELNLNPKQNKMRTDLEMWVMDEIPVLFGVDDSEELDEDLQEDGQALKVTQVLAESSADGQKKLLSDWLKQAPDADAAQAFSDEFLTKVQAIQALGGKKKKKKKDGG